MNVSAHDPARPDDELKPTHGLLSASRRELLETALRLAGFGLVYYVAYRYGMTFSQTTASPFWFPDSVLLCALLVRPTRQWWAFVLVTLPIRLYSSVAADIPLWFLMTTFVIDSAKGLVAAAALRRFVGNPTRLETFRDYALFCLIAVALVPMLGAFAGAAARRTLGFDFWSTWQQWFMGNVLTQLVITPAILYWVVGLPRRLHVPAPGRFVEATLLTLGLIVSGYLAFGAPSTVMFAEPTFYVPVAFLFWAGIRFGMAGASGAVIIIAGIAVAAAIDGRGPFAGLSPRETASYLQTFLLWRSAPVYLVAILIAQRAAIEQSLRESEARFRTMADFAPVLIWVSGPDKNCTYVNRRWLEFTGRTHAEEVGHGWLECMHPDDRERYWSAYHTAFDARDPLMIEFQLRRRDGQYRALLSHAIPRSTASGSFLGYIGSCIDITERKQAEAEVHRQRMELTHMARISTVGQLSFTLAHELSQPLMATILNAETGDTILRKNPLDEAELQTILDEIRRDSRRAGEIVERMRSLLRRRELEFESLSLADMLEEILVLVRADMLARNVLVSLCVPRDLPRILGDRVHLQQVLLNLLINGADAMSELPPDKRRLDISGALADGNLVEVTVRDVGRGVPHEKLQEIFEPFQTTKSTGMGLGLSICRTIIDAHGGRIWASNNESAGATFHFTLRIVPHGDRPSGSEVTYTG